MNEIERVARAIDSIRLFMRFNDWTSDCVPGLPIEICRWTGEHDESCEVIARYPGQRESDGAAHLERHISEARATAAIAAMRGEPVGWQPIETAPKDNAEYLVSNDRGQFVVWFDPDWTDGGWWMVSDGKDCERPLRGRTPTHWMPLPTQPPAERIDMSEELKACPFCGGEAEIDYRQSFRHFRTGEPLEQVAVYCRDCSANVSNYPGDLGLSRDETAEHCIQEWNTRATDAENQRLRAEVEALREALVASEQAIAEDYRY